MNKKIFITLSFLGILYWFLFDFLRIIEFDTRSFIAGSRLLFGLEGGMDLQARISKPLILIFPGLMEWLFGIDPWYAFLFQNIFLYYACGWLVYRIIFRIAKQENVAFMAMLAYVMCAPFAVHSLFIQSDAAGWCFGLLSIYHTLKHFSNENTSGKHAIISGLIISTGCLIKESAIIGLIFFFIYLLLGKMRFMDKVKYIFLCGLFFSIPFFTSFFLIRHYFHNSVVDRVIYEWHSVGQTYYDLQNSKQLFSILLVFWFLFAIGIYHIKDIRREYHAGREVAAFLITAILALLIMPLYPFIVDRILFMIAPCLMIFVAYGANRFRKYGLWLVITGGFINIGVTYLVYKFDISGLVTAGAVFYLMILSGVYFATRKQVF